MALRRGETAKLPVEQEEALLNSLRIQRELVAHAKLQSEAHAVACKLGGMDIAKVAEEAVALANKDRKNFGFEQSSAVAAITLNAVMLSASVAKGDDAGGKGGKGGKGGYGGAKAKPKAGGNKKAAAPKIGAKVERLPPPTYEAAKAAIDASKDTLAKVSNFKDGQLALLRAFESWILIEHHEPALADAPKMLEVFLESGVVDKEVFQKYWTNVQSTREVDAAETVAAQARSKEAGIEHADALAKLKVAETEMADALQRAKWAAIDVQNARCGNQPTDAEVAREKEATANNNKALQSKLQHTKVLEMCHKRQVTSLNTREEADRNLADKTNKMRPLELMNTHAASFFEPLMDGKPTEVPAN